MFTSLAATGDGKPLPAGGIRRIRSRDRIMMRVESLLHLRWTGIARQDNAVYAEFRQSGGTRHSPLAFAFCLLSLSFPLYTCECGEPGKRIAPLPQTKTRLAFGRPAH